MAFKCSNCGAEKQPAYVFKCTTCGDVRCSNCDKNIAGNQHQLNCKACQKRTVKRMSEIIG